MDADRLRALLREHLPVRTLTPLGGGLDNRTYEVDGELVARVALRPDEDGTRFEADILATVRAATDVPVPEPIVVVPDAGLLVYRKLRGAPLSGVSRGRRAVGEVVSTLERFRRDIATIRVDRTDLAPAAEWRDEARESYAAVADHVPARLRPAVERFLAEPGPPPPARPVFCHNDLGAEHVLVDPGTGAVTGVIDWTDAAIADPAVDAGRLLRDLGPAAIAPEPATVFYARCTALEDLAYGRAEGRDAYAVNALAALDDLFTA